MSTIAVNFQAQGVSRVMEAFASIEKRAVQFQTKAIRAQQLLTSAVQREAGKQEKAVATSADREARAFEKESARMRKLAEKSASARTKAADAVAKAAEQAFQRETKAFERESERMGRIARRAADKRIQEAKRAADAEVQARKQFASGVSGRITSAAGGVFRTGAAIAGGVLALGGGFTAADSISTVVGNRGRAADIAIQSGGELNKKDIYSRASNAATAYGMTTERALASADRFLSKSGNAKMSLDIMPDILALATATGGDAGDIGEAGGQVANADRSLNKKQVGDIMRGWAGQGRAGSVDMRELASLGSRIAASAGMFAGDKAANMVSLGAVTQVATAGGASSAAEATEAAAQLGTDAWKHKEKFAKLGAFKDGKLVDPETLIKKAVFGTKGNRGELQELFGERSIKAVQGAANIYTDAFNASKKSGGSEAASKAAAEKAVDEAFGVFKKAALTEEQVKADANARLEETDKKLEAAMNKLRDSVGERLVPVIERLIPRLDSAVPKLADFAEKVANVAMWFAENPFKGIIALIAGAVAKDVAAAGIGKIIASAIMNATGGGRPGLPGGKGGAPVGAMGNLGAAAAIAGTAIAVEQVGETGIDAYFGSRKSEDAHLMAGGLSAANAAASATALGAGTKEEAAKRMTALQAAQDAVGKSISAQQKNIEDNNGVASFDRNMREITTFFGSDAGKTKQDAEKRALDQSKKEFDELAVKIRDARKAFEDFSTTAANADMKNARNRKALSSPDRD